MWKYIKLIAVATLSFVPFMVYADNAVICPLGYVCTPSVDATTASSSAHVEKIFYMSQADLTDGLQSLQKNASSIDVVAPQVYTIETDLEATGSVPIRIETIAKTNGIKVMPLITNQGFSQSLMHNFLSSTTAEDALVSYLVSEAQSNGYIGWQFDFEHMSATDTDLYSAFVEKTAAALHNSNLILSVAAVARVNDDTSTSGYKNWSGVYNYARIAKSVDFISIMAYDDPNSSGPVASIPYDKSVLAYLANKVPPNKISLGTPLYYWGWDQTAPPGQIVRHAGTGTRLQYVRMNWEPREFFSADLGIPYLSYQLEGHIYVIWYDDSRSVQARLDLVKTYGLRGFSAWVLGMENPDVWNAINKITN